MLTVILWTRLIGIWKNRTDIRLEPCTQQQSPAPPRGGEGGGGWGGGRGGGRRTRRLRRLPAIQKRIVGDAEPLGRHQVGELPVLQHVRGAEARPAARGPPSLRGGHGRGCNHLALPLGRPRATSARLDSADARERQKTPALQ